MYTSIVSLGSWCITAHHLERLEISRAKSVFDWTFTFYKPLCNLIENDFEGLFKLENLQFDEGSVLDSGSGLRFMHAFSRDADNTIGQATIDREYEAARAKVDHLVDRWRHRVQQPGRHLYIWAIMPGWLDGTPSREAALNISTLLARTYPGHEFDLLAVSTLAEDVDWQAGRTFLRHAEAYAGSDPDWSWIGDVTSWDRIMAEFRDGSPNAVSAEQIGERDRVVALASDTSQLPPRRYYWWKRLRALVGA